MIRDRIGGRARRPAEPRLTGMVRPTLGCGKQRYGSSVELPRGFPRIAVGEGGFGLFGGFVILAREENGALARGVGRERGGEDGDGLFFRERFECGERGLLAIPFAFVNVGTAKEHLRLV